MTDQLSTGLGLDWLGWTGFGFGLVLVFGWTCGGDALCGWPGVMVEAVAGW